MNKTHPLWIKVSEEVPLFLVHYNPGKLLYLCIGRAGVGADTISSYGPVYLYKEGSGPADPPPPPTAHVISGQSGGGTRARGGPRDARREPLPGNVPYPASSAFWVLGPELCIRKLSNFGTI